LWRFSLGGGAGRVIRHLGYAYAGAWVLDHLPSWFS
jgi:hypothetical protein